MCSSGNNSPFSSPTAGHPTFCLYESDYSRYFRRAKSHSICSFVSGVFHFTCFQGSRYQNCIPFYDWITHHWMWDHIFLIHSFNGHLSYFPFWLLWLKLQWKFAFRCLSLCVYAKSLQLCLTLCDPMDCSPPGSSVHGILQARILEWVAMSSSRESSRPRDQSHDYCLLHWQVGSSPLAPPGKPYLNPVFSYFEYVLWSRIAGSYPKLFEKPQPWHRFTFLPAV